MAAAGADLLDLGGESTRPGFEPVSPQAELGRIVPAVERLLALSAAEREGKPAFDLGGAEHAADEILALIGAK